MPVDPRRPQPTPSSIPTDPRQVNKHPVNPTDVPLPDTNRPTDQPPIGLLDRKQTPAAPPSGSVGALLNQVGELLLGTDCLSTRPFIPNFLVGFRYLV